MESINIDKITSDSLFDPNNKLDPVVTTTEIIEYCRSLEKKIDNDKLIKLLCTIDYFYKAIGLMKIILGNKKYNECDILIEQYITELFSNKKIYKKIKEIKNVNSTNLIEMIHKNFYECKNENSTKIFTEMNKLKNKINSVIEDGVLTESNIAIKNVIPSIPSKFIMTKELFNILQSNVKDSKVRKTLEVVYNSKTKKILDDFAVLLLWRQKYAKTLGYNSYFDYAKQKGSVQSIKNLINDLLVKIEHRSRKESERIYRDLKKEGINKINQSDFSYYFEKFKPTNLFKPVDVLKILFEISESFFGLTFKPANFTLKLWSEKIMTCRVLNIAKEDLGFVHFDLYKTNTKKTTSPLCMKLSGSPKRICLISSYSDINTKCMTFSDILLLFREFGCVIQMITHNKDELIVKNDEFDILMAQVMEYIAWEKPIIEKLCVGMDSTVIDHIIFMRYINFANTIKTKCVNSLFDHIIHNSNDLIDIIKQNTTQGIGSGDIIETLYKKIYNDIWSSQSDIINLDITGISPNVIMNEISGNESTLYSNILTEILSFAIFTLIKNGEGKNFIKDVLSQPSHNLRVSLNHFIEKLKADSYYLYLQEVIGYEEIDTEMNLKTKEKLKNTNSILTETSANYFDENQNSNNSDSESDSDNIIVLEKNK